jgi:molybdopterin converting factor small subunit
MHVEFLGIPRERAGLAELDLEVGTLGQLLRELAERFPGLRELVPNGQLHPSVVANLNGDEFVSDPGRELTEHDHLLILSADVGG